MDPDYDLFAKVVECGSLSSAGRTMGISPAMVSKRIARLEARLGVHLVHRTTRRLSLTERGEHFYRDVKSILVSIEQAEARLTGEGGILSGRLRISAPTSFGRLHIAPYLKRFIDEHPRILLELNLSDEITDLIADGVDVAIRIASDIAANLTARRLATSDRVLCAAPAYLADFGTPRSIMDLRRHRLLAATGQLPWMLVSGRGVTTVAGSSHVRTNSSEVVRELARAGVGIALRSLWDVCADLADGRLIHILDHYRGSTDVGIYAVHPKTSFTLPMVDAFVDFLGKLYAPIAPWEAREGKFYLSGQTPRRDGARPSAEARTARPTSPV